MKTALSCLLLLVVEIAAAQNQDRIWVFDDSIKIDFNNLSNPVVSNVPNQGILGENFASIADSSGTLLFYISNSPSQNIMFSAIYNSAFQLVPNGDSLVTNRSYTQGTL